MNLREKLLLESRESGFDSNNNNNNNNINEFQKLRQEIVQININSKKEDGSRGLNNDLTSMQSIQYIEENEIGDDPNVESRGLAS